jgi:hypothetical protein
LKGGIIMSNKTKNMLIACTFILLLLVTVVLGYFIVVRRNFTNTIVIKNNKEIHNIMEVSNLRLLPSESKEYEISLSSRISGDFIITMNYNENKDGGMKEFVDVKIMIKDDVIYDGKLSELFNEEAILTYKFTVTDGYESKILILYSMDESVGNEAERTYADFEIDFTVKNNIGG